MAYVLLFAVILALFLAGLAIYRYGNIQRQHPLVTFSVLIAWCFSFMIVFTLPLDITNVSFPFPQIKNPPTTTIDYFLNVFQIDRLQTMHLWKHTKSSRQWKCDWKNRWKMSKTLGDVVRRSPHELMAVDLLDFTAAYLVTYAFDAILFKGWWFHCERKVQVRPCR